MTGLARSFLFIAALVLVTVACGARITVDPQTMPAATVGQSFGVPMTGNDGNPTDHPLILSVNLLKGNLPPGVSVYQSPGDGTGSGGIRGTPTTAGTYTFTIEVAGDCTMGGCMRASRDYTVVVNP